jgi:uncharacterized protein YqiB (DUF1249 family)|tara:strand:+ start:245 stop:697 length:453 start_codon:yes stop_codon:yes gene_type:complete
MRNNLRLRSKEKGLSDLINIFEKNYIKFEKLFPLLKEDNNFKYFLPEGSQLSEVSIKIEKMSLYTTFVEINQSSKKEKSGINTQMEIAIYHDIKMAEVRSLNGKKVFWMKYKYPNKNMFHKNEKIQINVFLSEWLDFSEKQGLSKYLVEI